MGFKLFLDDERKPGDVTWVNGWVYGQYEIVRSYYEFVNMIENFGVPEHVSFDHDLDDDHYVQMIVDMQKNSTGQLAYATAEKLIDHDYGPVKTGYDCAKWLVHHCIDHELPFPTYTIHSMNPVGSQRIAEYIEWSKDKFNFL